MWTARSLFQWRNSFSSMKSSPKCFYRFLDTSGGFQEPEFNLNRDHSQVLITSVVGECTSKLHSFSILPDFLESRVQKDQLCPSNVSSIFCDLKDGLYGELATIPWLHNHNQSIAFMQLLMNNCLTVFDSVNTHPQFLQLLEYTEKNLNLIPDASLPDILLSVLLLRLSLSHSFVHKILYRLHDQCSEMSVYSLARVSESLRIFQRGDIKLWGKMSQRVQDILNLHEMDIPNLCTVLINLKSMLGVKTSLLGLNWINSNLEHLVAEMTLKGLATVLRFFSKFNSVLNQKERLEQKERVFYIIEHLCSRVDEFEAFHIAEICNALKIMGCYPETFAEQIQKKGLEILNGRPFKISKVVNLSYGFTRNIPFDVRHKLEDALFQGLPNADVLLLSNMADVFNDIECVNKDLIQAYHQKVYEKIDSINQFITRFNKIFRFINRRGIANKNLQMQFHETLLSLLHGQQGLSVWMVSYLSEFLLPTSKPLISPILMNKLLQVIPQCSLNDLTVIISGLNKLNRPWIRQMHNQVLQLQSCLHQNITDKLDCVENIEVLIQMVTKLYLKTQKRDYGLLDALMGQFPRFTKSLTEKTFTRLMLLLHQSSYRQTEILDDMVQYVIDGHTSMGFAQFSKFVDLLNHLGYVPTQFEKLTEVCLMMLDKFSNDMDILTQLKYTLSLCLLQIYPDVWLTNLFTFEYIDEIDDFIDVNLDAKGYLEKVMMKLNRCVVLECPHLDIPWFQEDYCKQIITTEEIRKTWMNKEVEMAISEALDGPNYFRQFVYSPYYHMLNFECILDSAGKPVTYGMTNIDDLERYGYQRIAILVFEKDSYCINGKHLNGFEEMKLRHLEILGYKVVQVPHFDWNSMALSDWQEKVDYLKRKVLH